MRTHSRARFARRLIPSTVALLTVTAVMPGTAEASAPRDRVVVTFADGVSAADRAAVLADVDPAAAATASADVAAGALSLPDAAPAVLHTTPAQRAELAADDRVRSVDADVPIRADEITVRDPAWPEQRGLRGIRADEVWSHTTGDADVVIAVVDTGVDPANRDLAGRLVDGHDFVNDDGDPRDDNGHGTAVATIAGAASDTFGVAGVCWRCRIMPVKVLDADGKGFLSDATLGIAWAVEHGADIVNVSLGAGGSMPALDTALQLAEEAGVLVVASAGNAGNTVRQWPAADPRVLAVAGVDAQDERAPFSSYGDWVDVAAPGCNPAGWLDNAVTTFCGTSSAAPLVSGAAALLSAGRERAGAEIEAALRSTAVAAGAGLGAGRIDAAAAFDELPRFADIADSVHLANIEALAAAGVTSGCTPLRYCPSRHVTRGQIATFLDRALELPSGTATFADVPADHPHADGIAAVASAGITTGCDPDRFCPGDHVTRGQMASLLHRALELPDGPRRFEDVAPANAHAEGVWAIAAAGITTGCAPDRFCPGATVDRAQMASFLVRALEL
ncbi:MAG TPA: S8 family serine peptidase [Euzebyales bacterium]|nr:S8 family serine peptidase [Euzebyales bacterium]